MAGPARRHHVVSKFYLRYFADENDRVTTVELPGDRSFPQSIRDASVHNDYYTVVDQTGEPSDLAEKALGEVEAGAAEAWREIIAGTWPLSDEHRGCVAGWAALQLLRGTRVRDSMSEVATHGVLIEGILGGRARVREQLIAEGMPADDEAVNRHWVALFTQPFQAQVHANHHLQHLAELLPVVTHSLLERYWLLTVFERKGLATSDHPVHVVPNEELSRVGLGTGIENAEVIHLPLSRRHSLAMYLRGAVPAQLAALGRDTRWSGVAKTALYSNSCAVQSARRFLFHHPDDAPLTGIPLHEPRDQEVEVNAQCGDGLVRRTSRFSSTPASGRRISTRCYTAEVHLMSLPGGLDRTRGYRRSRHVSRARSHPQRASFRDGALPQRPTCPDGSARRKAPHARLQSGRTRPEGSGSFHISFPPLAA